MNGPVMSQRIPQTAPDYDRTRVIGRPNGFFWEATHGREYGPFCEPARSGAESEIGIAPYIDPDTGAPAEEERPRLEEH